MEEVYGEAGRAAGEMEVGDSEDNKGREGRKWKGRNGEARSSGKAGGGRYKEGGEKKKRGR